MSRFLLTITLVWLFAAVQAMPADSEFFKKFKEDYITLDQDLLNHVGEHAEIKDFVYEKDLATFTFTEGDIHLLRFVDGRPTTALFYGKGHATVKMPTHVERMALYGVSRDSLLDVDFETCFIRMSDDFDVKLKEKFTFEQKELKWKEFNVAKQSQGEFFFRPNLYHLYDGYFELLRSHYERAADGYFWIDFNRYVFEFDPNRPEEVLISYEYEGGDQYASEAARFQRQERRVYDDSMMSHIAYPTTMLERSATLTMGGLDGRNIDAGDATAKLVINDDSLRYLSLFLHYNLPEDSIYYDGNPAEYYRRKDFNFIGIVLPEYRHKGDTLTFRMWFKGKNYYSPLPYVEDPTPTPLQFTFYVPKGFNYLMPGMGPHETAENGLEKFTATPSMPLHMFRFWGYAKGYDTTQVVSDIGVPLNLISSEFIDKKNYTCFVPDDQYRPAVIGAFNFLSGRLGGPSGVFGVDLYPLDAISMPGIIAVPQTACVTDAYISNVGGILCYAGTETGQQYFGSALRPLSVREGWLADAASEYLGMLYIQSALGAGTFYSNLASRRDSLVTQTTNWRDMPLASGDRANPTIRHNKGVWMLHMLRMLLFDIDSGTDSKFLKFMAEASVRFNAGRFSNNDFVKLAEKYYGGSLTAFFDHWLYGLGYPKYNVEYAVSQREGGYVVDVTTDTKIDNAGFNVPVLIRVPLADGSSQYARQDIPAGKSNFTLGPFASQPTEIAFNEFFSVLCESSVKKK